MFNSIQIKQEYNSIESKIHENLDSPQSQIDYSVFNNQNLEYAYHQLPHFWDQALQVQTTQNSKDNSYKNEKSSPQCISRVNQTIPFLRSNYISHYLEQQQQQQQQLQNTSLATNQHVGEQSQIGEVNSSVVENKFTESRASPAMNNNFLTNAEQSSSTIIKYTAGRPSKYSNTNNSGKKLKCQCEICFKEFGHKSNLFIHMRTHNGERPYKCKECDKCFTHSGNLAIHMRTHSGERPYACQVCGKMFSHSGNLSTHLRTHSGVKPYKCNICGKEFRHSGNLSIHERIHSGVKPFQCKICGKEFYHSGNLTTHMKKHPVMLSLDHYENNVLPGMNTEYICDNIDQVKETDTSLISDTSDVKNTLQNEKMTMEDLNKKFKSS